MKILTLLFGLLLSGCFAFGGEAAKPVFVTFDDLKNNGAKFDGQTVCLKAYYREAGQSAALYPFEPSEDQNWFGKMLWVGPSTQQALDKGAIKRQTSSVIIVGIFVNKPQGINGQYFGIISELQLVLPVAEPK